MLLKPTVIGWVAFVLVTGTAIAQQPVQGQAPVPIEAMTAQKFAALAPEALISVHGKIVSKREILVQSFEASARMTRELADRQAQSQAEWVKKRAEYLSQQRRAILAQNEQARVEIGKQIAEKAAQRPANYHGLLKEAVEVLDDLQTAPADRRPALLARAQQLHDELTKGSKPAKKPH